MPGKQAKQKMYQSQGISPFPNKKAVEQNNLF
ncbi:hypothetical protein OA78_1411, partial [Latilactobacillus curvatus]